jgi:predicted dehydrogenase
MSGNGETPRLPVRPDPPGERPLTYGVVGLGYWGPNLVRVLSEIPDADLRWICDVDASRLERLGRRYPAAQRTERFQDLLDDESLDAVLIATPVYTHFELASRALAADKHTFVEKPLAASSDRADDLLAMAAARERVLMCGHTFLYSPPVRAVRSLIERDEIGDIFFISSSRVNLGLHQHDVSVVWDLGPHDFSILNYWLGELPVSVRAVGRDSIIEGIPDVAFVTLTYASGIVANVELSWLAPSKLRRTVVVGSKKMVVYEDGTSEPLRLFDHGVVYEDPESFGEHHLSYRTGDILSPNVESYEPLAAQLADFALFVRTGEAPRSAAMLARDVVLLTEAADRSLRHGGELIEIARPSPFRRVERQRERDEGAIEMGSG